MGRVFVMAEVDQKTGETTGRYAVFEEEWDLGEGFLSQNTYFLDSFDECKPHIDWRVKRKKE